MQDADEMPDHSESTWRRPHEKLSLGLRDVHIWRAALDVNPDEMASMREVLSPEEIRQAERFLVEGPGRRFIVSHGILRRLLAMYLDVSPRAIRFTQGPHGKPYVSPEFSSDIQFNLSHSGDIALFAFARGREVGIDVEQVRADVEIEQLAERFYSPRESSAIRELPPDLRSKAFFTCWVRKEAYLKAVGKGIAFGPDRVEVFQSPLEPMPVLTALEIPDDPLPWRALTVHPGEGYMGALVTVGDEWEAAFWQR